MPTNPSGFHATKGRRSTYCVLRFRIPTRLFERLERDCRHRRYGGNEIAAGSPMTMHAYLADVIECWAADLTSETRRAEQDKLLALIQDGHA